MTESRNRMAEQRKDSFSTNFSKMKFDTKLKSLISRSRLTFYYGSILHRKALCDEAILLSFTAFREAVSFTIIKCQ